MPTTDIKTVHDWFDFMTNKAEGTYYTHEDYDNALHRAQMQYFNELYAPYGMSEKLHDGLSPFKVTYPFLTSDTPNGVITIPVNHQYLLGGHFIVVDGSTVRHPGLEIVAEDAIGDRLDDQIKPISAAKPVATMVGKLAGATLLQCYPETPLAGKVFYLKQPTPPVFGYTQAGRVFTYDVGTSTQLEWNEAELNEVMIRALEFLGVDADDEQMVQYANVKSKTVN